MRLGTIAFDGTTAACVISEAGAAPVDGFRDVGALLRAGDIGIAAARRAAGAEFQPYRREDLVRPVVDPTAVICVGLNYRTHVLEMGRELPEHPTLFAKLPRALADPVTDIPLPESSQEVDYEGELVIVIGRRGHKVSIDEARAMIAGYTLMNDVSMRDFQFRSLQWFAGKNFERSSPTGPWIVTADEVGDLTDRELLVTVNGEERQRARLGDLIFDPPQLVADVSEIFTLEPGDLVATGTPGGVGYGMEPKQFIRSGDVVTITVDGIGALRNRFIAE